MSIGQALLEISYSPAHAPGMDADEIRALVARLIEERGFDFAELSRTLGKNHAYVQQYVRRGTPRVLPEGVRDLLAPLLGLRPEELKPGGLALPASNVRPALDAPDVSPGALPRDVPILGTAVGGVNGDFELNGEIVDMARRPPALAGMRSVFALYVVGDSMSPAFEPGDLVFLQRSRHPASGDYVVVEMKPRGDDGEVRPALLKRFIKIAGDTLILSQFNPPMDLPVPRTHVLYVYRVFKNNELYGV